MEKDNNIICKEREGTSSDIVSDIVPSLFCGIYGIRTHDPYPVKVVL